ncbi:heliorhodopsin HeR [bacterium]|nr:heliorhodopsin HeR [bacterium]
MSTAVAAAPDRVFVNLRRFNLIMGVFHLVQGIAMIVLSSDFSITLSTLYLRAVVGEGTFSLEQNLQEGISLPFGPAVAMFLLLSAIAHFLLGTVLYDWYVKNLKRNMNPARWYEYALSSSLMIVLIGMLVGIYDVSTLILMFGLNAMMNLFGLLMELHNQTTDKTDWTSFIYGCIAGIIPWIVVVFYIVGAAQSVDTEIPGFVYAIIASIFVFFNIFALNMWLQYRGIGPWKNYLFGERAYIVLSLVAKSALAWQIWSGQLQPQ